MSDNTPIARLVIAFMLAAFAAVFAASLVGMTGAMEPPAVEASL